MRFHWSAASVVISMSLVGVGCSAEAGPVDTTASSDSALVGGTVDTSHHNVGAIIGYDPTGAPFVGCSGSLIAPKVFLTAAHCVGLFQLPVPAGTTYYLTFSDNLFNPSGYIPLDPKHMIKHPSCHPVSIEQFGCNNGVESQLPGIVDMGIIYLPAAVKNITPAKLPPANILDSLNCKSAKPPTFTIVGFGFEAFNGVDPATIVWDGNRYQAPLKFQSNVNGAWVQSQTPGVSTCLADSGGPLIWHTGGQDYVVGLESATKDPTGGCAPGSAERSARVDNPAALSFIASHLVEH